MKMEIEFLLVEDDPNDVFLVGVLFAVTATGIGYMSSAMARRQSII